METSNDRNRIIDGIHNRGGPQLIQSSVNAFYYNDYSVSDSQRPRTVPRQVSRLFTGRQDVAMKLAQAFAPTAESCSKSQRIFVLYGLGGTGKSEICLKFASDHNDNYWGIFWIDCGNQSKAKEGFQRIANLCRLPTSDFEATKDYLSSSSEKWLLILDNADDPEIDYSVYFPSQKVGDIIITTRNEDLVQDYATAGFIYLDQLQFDLARDLLLRAAGVAQASWQDKARAASAIVQELGGHTLAILQAASFIKQACPIEDYLKLYHKQKDLLFKFSKGQELSTYKTVHATFEVSILRLQSSGEAGDVDAKNALNLLNILSFMHFEGAFDQIFASAAARALEIQQQNILPHPASLLKLSKTHAKQLPKYFPTGQGSGSDLQWRRACNKLKIFSLIKRDAGDDVSLGINIHPLVHTWARERQDMALQSQSWYTALLVLALVCPDDTTLYDDKYELLRSHIRACFINRKAEHAQDLEPYTIPAVLMHLLCAQWFLHEDYETDQLLALMETELKNDSQNSMFSVTKIKRGTFQNEQLHAKRNRISSEELNVMPENLEILTLQAQYLKARGDEFSALRILQKVVEIQEETLDHEHPDLLVSQFRLAEAYLSVESSEMAVEILERNMPTTPKFAVSDPLRLNYLNSLANAYRKSGRTKQAMPIAEEVVNIDKQTLEPTDRRRLSSQVELANVYLLNSQNGKAVDLLENVISIQKKIFHSTHARVFGTQHSLANAYWRDGRNQDAKSLLEQMIEARSQEPIDWRSLAEDLQLLANIYAVEYQDEKALELVKRASEADDKTNVDIWHSHRLVTRGNLARMYQLTDKDEEAIKVLESTVYAEERDKIDAGNKELIELCHRLVKAYRSSGRLEKATSLENRIPKSEAAAKRPLRGEIVNPAAPRPSKEALPSSPICSCGGRTVRLTTSMQNPNGNAGRAYWKCTTQSCLRWHGWA